MKTRSLLTLCAFVMSSALLSSAAVAAENDADQVVVSQGGVSVTMADVDAYVSRIPKDKQAGFANSPTRIETMLRSMLTDKQLAKQARELGLDKDPLLQRQIDLAADAALSKARISKFAADLVTPNFDVQAEEQYLGYKEKYVVPGRVDVRHVLIGTKERNEEEARKLAEDVLAQARAKPDDFAALVEKYSDDPSKTANKGVIPNATTDNDAPQIKDVSATLNQLGEVSPTLAHTPYGFHIIQLAARTPDRQLTFAEAKDDILAKLREEWTEQQVRGFVDNIKNNPMDASQEAVASLRTRYMPKGAAPVRPDPADKIGRMTPAPEDDSTN
jgi:peptidyl-prolyl cis-trans isomerase C